MMESHFNKVTGCRQKQDSTFFLNIFNFVRAFILQSTCKCYRLLVRCVPRIVDKKADQ